MRGELIAVWPEAWREVWEQLFSHEAVTVDVYGDLYRELAATRAKQPDSQEMAETVADPERSKQALRDADASMFRGEQSVVRFFEQAFLVLDDLGGDALSNQYFVLFERFLDKYSLRYELRRPFLLAPTISGVFSGLIRELKLIARRDPNLDRLMKDFESAVRDLRMDSSDNRIKTCIQKQVNLIEAMGKSCPGVTQSTLGAMCEQVGTWPHSRVKDAIKSLYGFASDYPGIRHAGTPANALRDIEMRDFVALSILFLGFAPYLADQLNADLIYRGM